MTSLQAVVFYGGFHLLMLAFVSYNVSRFRLKHKVNLGDGGNDEVLRAIRAQGNYVEYAPLAIFGLYLLSATGVTVLWIHLFGAFFTIARLGHFLDLGLNKMPKGRFVGTIGTMLFLLVLGGTLLVRAFL